MSSVGQLPTLEYASSSMAPGGRVKQDPATAGQLASIATINSSAARVSTNVDQPMDGAGDLRLQQLPSSRRRQRRSTIENLPG